MLDDLGLIPTLRWYTESYAKRLGIPINFKITALDKRLDLEIETAIYRIVQEALTNIAKYAQAKEVYISLEKKGSRLITKVEDNGKGFTLNPTSCFCVIIDSKIEQYPIVPLVISIGYIGRSQM
jgi:signal transduction histidine kinase